MSQPARGRRVTLAYGAVGVAALAAGAGWSWYVSVTRSATPVANGLSDPIVTHFFAQTLSDADGAPQSLARWQGIPVVVNFWATWCEPCVREMPDLQRLRDAYAARGVQVLGVGIDQPERIRDFRDQFHLTLPLFAAASAGSALMQALGNSSGSLPYTVLISRTGSVLWRHLGQIDPERLSKELDAAVAN